MRHDSAPDAPSAPRPAPGSSTSVHGGHAAALVMRRRGFLRAAGGAAAAALTDPWPAGAVLGTEHESASGKRNDPSGAFDHVGIWYFLPSFFEYSLGPWQPEVPANPDLVQLWKQTIDWYADNGLNLIVIHLGPYGGEKVPIGPDRIRFGWGYHYVLNFDRFPEARCLPPDFVRRNQDIVRRVTECGQEKGVAVYTHHYNFLAPRAFVDAHPEITRLEILRAGNVVDLHGKLQCWDMRRLLYYDVCWNKPLYREFMVECFREYHELFPAAAGILVTPGERARCTCIECIGERPNEAAAKVARYQDSPQKRKTIAHFVRVFAETLRELGKTPLVRTWIAGVNAEWADVLPRGITYVTKYSLFDLTDGGPDPQILPWLRAGHDMWFMKEISGNENAGPMVLTPPEAFDQLADGCREAGVRGVLGVINSEWGLQYRVRRVQFATEVLFANSFGKRVGDPPTTARQYYTRTFGEPGSAILDAACQYMEVPFNMSRVLGSRLEGFTCEFAYHFADFFGRAKGHPGTLGIGETPNEWLSREIVPFNTYVSYLKEHPWTDGFRAEVTGEGTDPLQFLEEITSSAKAGWDRLRTLAPTVSPDAEDEMALLLNSAHLAYLVGMQWGHWFRARLYYTGALGTAPEATRRELARRAVGEYEAGLAALRQRLPLLEELAELELIDPQMTIDNYYRRRDLANRVGYELPSLKEELSHLLG